jgi:hypothetical protein
MVTPIHFRVIPYSPDYILGWPDELTEFWHNIRLEIEFILASISQIHYGKTHQVVYETNIAIRENFVDAHGLPATAFSLPTTPKPLIYHGDIDLESANWHPFIRPYERAFLRQALPYFNARWGPGSKLQPLLHSLLMMRFAHQAEASHAFLMGKITHAPMEELYTSTGADWFDEPDDTSSDEDEETPSEWAELEAATNFDTSLWRENDD